MTSTSASTPSPAPTAAPSSSPSAPSELSTLTTLIEDHYLSPSILPQLEEYITTSYKSNYTDFDVARYLLKLYSLFPDSMKLDIVTKVLIKSLCSLPRIDFYHHIANIPSHLLQDDPIKSLCKLYSLLEGGNYKKFWSEKSQLNLSLKNVIDNFPSFDYKIRYFIINNIKLLYKSISINEIRELLNLQVANDTNKKLLEQFITEECKWKKSEDGKTVNTCTADGTNVYLDSIIQSITGVATTTVINTTGKENVNAAKSDIGSVMAIPIDQVGRVLALNKYNN